MTLTQVGVAKVNGECNGLILEAKGHAKMGV